MKLLFIFVAIVFPCILGDVPIPIDKTIVFRSLLDDTVITVHESTDVTTEPYADLPEQKWTIVTHPIDPDFLEFKNEAVPYNDLSGYENPPDNPVLFPKYWGLVYREELDGAQYWNIVVRGRWCIQAVEAGERLDRDDCESYHEPRQLWRLEEVA